MNSCAFKIASTQVIYSAAIPVKMAELFPASIEKVFEQLQSLSTDDARYEPGERKPSEANIEWATKVLLRVLPRHFLKGAEIDTFNGEIHVTWESRDKKVVVFLPAPGELKLYKERLQGDNVVEHHLADVTLEHMSELSHSLRWLFE